MEKQISENFEKAMKIITEGEKLFELWEPIEDNRRYHISSFGRVKNISNNKILIPSIDGDGYYHVRLWKWGEAKTYRIHILVAKTFLINPNNKPCVDHKDGNPKNNHIHNLRYATYSENGMNKRISKTNTSGYKGVGWNKRYKKWCASITVNKKVIRIGSYNNLQDAVKARQAKAKELFGEFLNKCEV